MAGVGVLLLFLAMYWLDIWTAHGHEAAVPDVKSLSYNEARIRLEADGFEVVLSDSVYDRNARPGEVVEQNPKVGAIVKPGRTIYLTINAIAPKNVTLPALTDISVRQATSILQGLGINNIVETSVVSEFKDLVIAVKRDGVPLSAGARIPVNSTIVLEVGDGMPDRIDSMEETDQVQTTDQLNLL